MTNQNIFEVIGVQNQLTLLPSNIFMEIIQNIQVILTTIVGSVPLDRRFGLDVQFIDDPMPKANMKLVIFILETIQEYEPRVEILDISFVPDTVGAANGKLLPKVRVRILNEYTQQLA